MEKRLQTILAHAGAASRRKAEALIEQGKVEVDGRVVRQKGLKLDPERHRILVDGIPLEEEEKKVYFLLNKPQGFISTVNDTHGRRKITDIFTGIKARLYPVGRLDKDTTGVILVTNDGDLAHRLSHPSFEVSKEYVVKTDRPLPEISLRRISSGMELDGKMTSPCEIERLRNCVYKIKLHEGRNRQIKKMFLAEGVRVMELDRGIYAGLSAGKLKRGEYRELTSAEIKTLKKSIKKDRRILQ